MRRVASSMLPKLAAGVALGVSVTAFAAGGHGALQSFSEQGYGLDQIAAEFAAGTAASGMEAGQAGRAGPETVPMMGATVGDAVAWPAETRYSVEHIAAEHEAARAAERLSSGQAGRAGPEALPDATPGAADMKSRSGPGWPDDATGGSFW